MMMKPYQLGLVAYLQLCCIIIVCTTAAYDEIVDVEAEPHPDPNDENYSGMIYIGRMDDDGKRVGWHTDNGRMEHLYYNYLSSLYSQTFFSLTLPSQPRDQIHLWHWFR